MSTGVLALDPGNYGMVTINSGTPPPVLQLRDGQYTFRTFITNERSELRLAGDNVLVVVKEQLHYRGQLTRTGSAGARAEPMKARRACDRFALACSLLQVSGCSTTEPAPPPSEHYVFDAAGAAGASAAGAADEGQGRGGADGLASGGAAGMLAAGQGGMPDGGAPDGGVGGGLDLNYAGSAPISKGPEFQALPCVAQFACTPEVPGYCPTLRCGNCDLWACITEEGDCGVQYAPDGGHFEGETFPPDCSPECEPSTCRQVYPGVP